MDKKLKIKIILGSIRPGRFGERPARWIFDEISKNKDLEVELLDLKDYQMPLFDSPTSPSMAGKKYENVMVQKWSAKIDEADGYVIVSPEYNHGYSSVLKNALDWIGPEWNKKPVGFVGYGSVGGSRAIEQLRGVAIELKMVPISRSIHIPWEIMMKTWAKTDIKNEELFEPLRKGGRYDHMQIFMDDLLWMAKALRSARDQDASIKK